MCCIICLLHGAFPAQPAANACRAIISTAPCLRFVTHWQRQFRTDSVSDISIKTPPNGYVIDPTGNVWVMNNWQDIDRLRSPRVIDCRNSPSCRITSWRLSATYNGAMPRLDRSLSWNLETNGHRHHWPVRASIMTRRFGKPFGVAIKRFVSASL